MANIPVEKTDTGVPPWLWILGLLLLALLAWFVISALGDDEEVVVADPIETVDPVVTAPVPVAALDLSNLYVTRVTGDRTFFVAPDENDTSRRRSSSSTKHVPRRLRHRGPGRHQPRPARLARGGPMEALGDVSLAGMGLRDADANAVTPTTEVIRVDGGDVEILDAPMGVVDVEVGT